MQDAGRVKRIRGRIEIGEARIYALSPSPVDSFVAELPKTHYRPGEHARVRFRLTTHDGAPGDRVVRLDYHADGEGIRPVMPRTLMLPAGNSELNMFIPLNAAAGKIWVTATDLSSGAECEYTLEIR